MFYGNGAARVFMAAAVLVITACSGNDAAPAATSADAGTAVGLCAALRDQTNVLARIANEAVAGIEGMTPEQRSASMLAGFDAAIDAAQRFAEAVDDVQLPDVAERAELLGEVHRGAELAVQELQAERSLFADDVPVVSDADVRGRVGQFFNGVEKAMSVVEPEIGRYERRDFQQAFIDEPSCDHVVQQYRVD